MECKACGFGYMSDYKPDVKEHEKYHQKWLEACKKFGHILPNHEREELKGFAAELEEQGDPAWETLRLWALFCRSVQGSDYNLNHISFPEYIEFMRSQDFDKELTKEEYLRSSPTSYAPLPHRRIETTKDKKG